VNQIRGQHTLSVNGETKYFRLWSQKRVVCCTSSTLALPYHIWMSGYGWFPIKHYLWEQAVARI
jgi:hypothetical protein